MNTKLRWFLLDLGRAVTVAVCKRLPVRDRVLFYSERSQDALMDNLRCVYDAVDLPKVICANRLPHPAVKKPLIYYYLYTSKVIVSDDYIRYLRVIRLNKKQKVVQLWHGGGLFKTICLDAPLRMPPEEERAAHDQYSAVLASAEACVPVYARAFGVAENVILPYGMPRTDALVDPARQEEKRKSFFLRYPDLKDKRIISYFPTFREEDGKRVPLDPKLDFAALERALPEDTVFVLHRHPLTNAPRLPRIYDRVLDLSDCPSPELFTVSSLIVTDYSSVVFDACLLDVPFVFYCPDMERYDRELYIDPMKDLPGEVTQEQATLIPALLRALEKPDIARVRAFRRYHMGACDGHATERAVKLILQYFTTK